MQCGLTGGLPTFAARAQRYKERFRILGIDLSRAIDTVNRDKLLSVLKPLLDDDEISTGLASTTRHNALPSTRQSPVLPV